MVFIPTTILGKLLLGAILFLYISLLVLNLVSYGGLQWITYTDFNVQFGLWRVCNGVIGAPRICNQWSEGRNTIDTATNTVIFSGKPGFIQAAEGLETVSLVFYVFAGILIIIGIIDLARAPLEYMFGAAAILLFLCIVFISASLGVMSVQGRKNHPGAHRDWAWATGLAGLIVTIVCVILIIAFILDTIRSNKLVPSYGDKFSEIYRDQGQQPWNVFPPTILSEGEPSSFLYPPQSQWPPEYQAQQFDPSIYFQNPFLTSTDVNQEQLSPALTALVQQSLSQIY